MPEGLPVRSAGRRAGLAALVTVLLLAAMGAMLGLQRLHGGAAPAAGSGATATPTPRGVGPSGTAGPAGSAGSPGASGAVVAPGRSSTSSSPAGAGLTGDDVAAGLRSRRVPTTGSGRLAVVPGSLPAPGKGRVYRVRIETEQGLDVDPTRFADFVLTTLNDQRSWGRGGRATFARTAGEADLRVVLASPGTTSRLCAPLVTNGTLSCGQGGRAVLTMYRWINGSRDYGADRLGYRQYLVNHEIGHLLGRQHVPCPGRGKRAPVMMQQTKGLRGCLKNPWPYPAR